MIIGAKYKLARRLGAPIFEKTQTQKYAQSEQKKGRKRGGRRKQVTEYGLQHNEKQKARFTYRVSEKQFSNYVKEALSSKAKSADVLFEKLELRLDNVIYRMGISDSRGHARQIVSHGHMKVNGRKVDIPSYRVKIGDKISIREVSLTKPIFAELAEKVAPKTTPSWIKFDLKKNITEIQGMPKVENEELLFNLGSIVEFYSR
jgi:small subunit ribosomal protein S4